MSNLILHLPPEALERIPVVRLTEFLAEHGLVVRAKVSPDLTTLTARVLTCGERELSSVRSNLETFTSRTATTPRVPPDGYDDGPEAA